MSSTRDVLRDWVKLVQQLPPPKPPEDTASLVTKHTFLKFNPMTHVLCACKKVVELQGLKVRDSGVTMYLDNICEGCPGLREKSVIVCVGPGCRQVVAHLDPCVDKEGFRFEKGRVYHTDACPTCKPNLKSAVVIEQLLFYRKKGVPFPKPSY